MPKTNTFKKWPKSKQDEEIKAKSEETKVEEKTNKVIDAPKQNESESSAMPSSISLTITSRRLINEINDLLLESRSLKFIRRGVLGTTGKILILVDELVSRALYSLYDGQPENINKLANLMHIAKDAAQIHRHIATSETMRICEIAACSRSKVEERKIEESFLKKLEAIENQLLKDEAKD